MTVNVPAASSPDPARRLLIKAAAWSIPMVALATSAPAAASSVPPGGTLVELSSSWDAPSNYGEVKVLLSPAPGPAASAEYVVFSDTAFEVASAEYDDDDKSIFRVTFTDIAPPPNQFTATVSIPGYTPLVVQLFAAG
ncbi:hypothetical protein BJQ94_03055 [Cryobacterium sp. SO2]|uniref:hypothetical protein n=1 Tax=Cryobacterium sp. SO2 TaxID=1897060 RepID=UPI00223D4554|nr:hypothetical protein [Cryobacterium sp. SO2]WEO78031.1 hypothetical protein BJQ94_03055 [Cryobacterium sp. SO2]